MGTEDYKVSVGEQIIRLTLVFVPIYSNILYVQMILCKLNALFFDIIYVQILKEAPVENGFKNL